jgi:hypothetical protein
VLAQFDAFSTSFCSALFFAISMCNPIFGCLSIAKRTIVA